VAGIGLNVIFDWLLVGGPTPWGQQLPGLNFGAPGLVLATVGVNAITCLALLVALQSRLGGLPLRAWARDSLLLLAAAVAAGGAAWALASFVVWPPGVVGYGLQMGLSGALGLAIYGWMATAARVPEAQQLANQFISQLKRRLPMA
jgi:putative peptidoglycan lipid II flippase